MRRYLAGPRGKPAAVDSSAAIQKKKSKLLANTWLKKKSKLLANTRFLRGTRFINFDFFFRWPNISGCSSFSAS